MTACRFLLIILTSLAVARAGEPVDYKDLYPSLPPVPEAENGWALMKELTGLCTERDVRHFEFYSFTEPEHNLVVDRESLDEFFELHGDVISMTRRILTRPKFQISPEQEVKGFIILVKGCKAIAAKAVIAAEDDRWSESWPDFLLLHGFSQKIFNAGSPTSGAMIGIGMTASWLSAATWAVQSCQDAKTLRAAAREFEPFENQKALFTGSDRSEFRTYLDHFELLKAGGEPLKKVLVTVHLTGQATEGLTDAIKSGADSTEGKAGIERWTEMMVTREKRIAEMLKHPPEEVRKQMKEATSVDWDVATAKVADWNRALLKADCSTWEQFQKTRPHPKLFLDGIALKQVEALHDVNEHNAKNDFRIIARSRMLQLNFALKAWHLGHKDSPERLDQLVPDYLPALPLDPFNGKAIGYDERLSLLWCVGPDLKDDMKRNIEAEDDKTEWGDDVVVRLRPG